MKIVIIILLISLLLKIAMKKSFLYLGGLINEIEPGSI
jgi:hypothetical protein